MHYIDRDLKRQCQDVNKLEMQETNGICLLVVSRASRIFLYFRWKEREGEKNTSGHSGQLPVPRRNVIIAAGHAHSMQIETFIQLCVSFVKLVPTLANCRDREHIQNDLASTR